MYIIYMSLGRTINIPGRLKTVVCFLSKLTEAPSNKKRRENRKKTERKGKLLRVKEKKHFEWGREG